MLNDSTENVYLIIKNLLPYSPTFSTLQTIMYVFLFTKNINRYEKYK